MMIALWLNFLNEDIHYYCIKSSAKIDYMSHFWSSYAKSKELPEPINNPGLEYVVPKSAYRHSGWGLHCTHVIELKTESTDYEQEI